MPRLSRRVRVVALSFVCALSCFPPSANAWPAVHSVISPRAVLGWLTDLLGLGEQPDDGCRMDPNGKSPTLNNGCKMDPDGGYPQGDNGCQMDPSGRPIPNSCLAR